MKIGMNLLLWTDVPEKRHLPLIQRIKDWGFDGVELPLDDMSNANVKCYAAELGRTGMEATGIVSMPAGKADPISEDGVLRQRAVDYVRRCIDIASDLGIAVIGGPLYQGLGRFTGTGPTELERQRCVDFCRSIADYAQEKHIVLAGEAINRFETYFVNTVEQACEIIDRVASPNFGLHVDTYHGNMEELDVCAAWLRAGKRIRHVHISENTRGIPGTGSAVPQRIFQTLKEIGYDGWLTIEAFGCDVPELASRLHIWRDLAPPEEIASQGQQYIAQMLAQTGIPQH